MNSLLYVLVLLGQETTEAATCKLSVQVTSRTGSALGPAMVIVKSNSNEWQRHARIMHGWTTIEVPYGDSTVQVSGGSVWPVERKIHVGLPAMMVSLATETIGIDQPPETPARSFTIQVQDKHDCGSGTMWARLSSLYADSAFDSTISTNGYALFEPLYVGDYILVVHQGNRVRAIQLISYGQLRDKVIIPLSSCDLKER